MSDHFLAVDIGNSAVKLGVFAGPDLSAVANTPTAEEPKAQRLRELLSEVGCELSGIDHIAICSVVPSATPAWTAVLSETADVTPYVIGPETDFGMTIFPWPPEAVGRDRLVAAAAAHKIVGTTCVVVDMGTATTVDVVDCHHADPLPEFRGGAIAPGFANYAKSLSRSGAQLYEVEPEVPETPIGRNTVEALQSGLVYGYAGLVEGLVMRMCQKIGTELDEEFAVYTGGWSSFFRPLIDAVQEEWWEPNLTLHGIRLVWKRNNDPITQ